MSIKNYELYLDESGDFNDGKDGRSASIESSVVGGILCDSDWMTNDRLMRSFKGKRVHTCSGYKGYYLSLLQEAINDGCRFILFENTEKIRIIDSNFTYMNIISEGLAHLFRDLSKECSDGVHIKVIIAQRGMALQEYIYRLKERMIMALGRKRVEGVDYQLVISDARTDIRLNYPDIICNTWFTRDSLIKKCGLRTEKFPPEARALIDKMYDPQWIYPVFEDMAATLLEHLIEERHYGEAMYRMCTLPKQRGFIKLQNEIINGIKTAVSYERDTWFTQMSLLIGQYNRMFYFKDGIEIAEKYICIFLSKLMTIDQLKKQVGFWLFDTNYYLLTMYDHLGNILKCQEHHKICNDNIAVIDNSWEHIDYYFGFRIRELNYLIGCFAFSEAIGCAKKLEKIFIKARDLFSMIEMQAGKEQSVHSELLGKVYGVQLEALINLLHNQPELYEEALEISDKALAEFTDSRDISRQYQWRCLLMVEAKKPDEAYNMLLKAVGFIENGQSADILLEQIYKMNIGTYDFLLWHFSNVMLLYKKEKHPMGDKMYQAINGNLYFLRDLQDENKNGHPWNLVLWNIARCARLNGDGALYKQLYRLAIKITRENKMNATMMTFAISMSADEYLWCRRDTTKRKKDIHRAEIEFLSILNEIKKTGLTDEMKKTFCLSECEKQKEIEDSLLEKISNMYLK